jgi:hypothetical protein
MPKSKSHLLFCGFLLFGTASALAQQVPAVYSAYNKAMKEALQKAGNLRVTETYLETDHSYSDHRIALQVAVLQWLDTVLVPVSK